MNERFSYVVLYRIKIVKCVDALIDVHDVEEAEELLFSLKKICGAEKTVYIHRLDEEF